MSPADWTRDLAAESVSVIYQWQGGDWCSVDPNHVKSRGAPPGSMRFPMLIKSLVSRIRTPKSMHLTPTCERLGLRRKILVPISPRRDSYSEERALVTQVLLSLVEGDRVKGPFRRIPQGLGTGDAGHCEGLHLTSLCNVDLQVGPCGHEGVEVGDD
jgi:hypothetical protein